MNAIENEEKKAIESCMPEKTDVANDFEEFKKVMLNTVSVAKNQAVRIDTMITIRDDMNKFFDFEHDVNDVRMMQLTLKSLYEEIEKVVQESSFDDFKAEEWVDPFAYLIRDAGDVENWVQAFEAYMAFMTVRPYAEKFAGFYRYVSERLEETEEE